MKTVIKIVFITVCSIYSYGQEKIFTIGYGMTFVDKDSTTLNFNVDMNRIPGQKEKEGGIYFINHTLDDRWFFYLKPTIDINVGSGVASAPNNISVGLDAGVGRDIPSVNGDLMSIYLNVSPEIIADKTFKNNLYVLSISPLFKYGFTGRDGTVLNSYIGFGIANGIRNVVEVSSVYYGRLSLPLYLELKSKKITRVKYVMVEGSKVKRQSEFQRCHWVNTFALNWVHSDHNGDDTKKLHPFFSTKLDYYITKNFGLNITYTNGRAEPLFTDNNSLSFGISLAR